MRLRITRERHVDLALDHLVAERAQQLRGALDGAALLAAEPRERALRRLERHRDAQRARRLLERRARTRRRARSVDGRVEEQRGVGDGPRERPVDAEPVPGVVMVGAERDAVALRLDPEQPAAAPTGNGSSRRRPSRARRRTCRSPPPAARAAARAAGRAVQSPRVAHRAVAGADASTATSSSRGRCVLPMTIAPASRRRTTTSESTAFGAP